MDSIDETERKLESQILELLRQKGPMRLPEIFQALSPRVRTELLTVILDNLGAKGRTVFCRAGYRLANES